MVGEKFTKKAWEFVPGEMLLGEDGSVFQIIKRERDIQEGVGAFMGLWLLRVDEAVGDIPAEERLTYNRFDPFFEMNGISYSTRNVVKVL